MTLLKLNIRQIKELYSGNNFQLFILKRKKQNETSEEGPQKGNFKYHLCLAMAWSNLWMSHHETLPGRKGQFFSNTNSIFTEHGQAHVQSCLCPDFVSHKQLLQYFPLQSLYSFVHLEKRMCWKIEAEFWAVSRQNGAIIGVCELNPKIRSCLSCCDVTPRISACICHSSYY